ncbi:MAG: hypothetical protein DSY46_06800 [Hydrogenimonas sp.]|nr:MAG: hypothetical protein DSY46_06800 [Hydrogenimonas sp.]
MKYKVTTLLTALLLFNTSVMAMDLDTCDYSSILQPVEDSNIETMQDTLLQSQELLSVSQNLLTISLQLLNSAETVNTAYINAMLRLSDDIGIMADRIGEMADRIIATELQIGIMADRILETQRIQSQNLALTQSNLLKAQENFNNLLIQLTQSQ